MKQRIKELADQAGFKTFAGPDIWAADDDGRVDTELNKFAELIIAKCVEIADDYSDSGIIPTKINKYFGVE